MDRKPAILVIGVEPALMADAGPPPAEIQAALVADQARLRRDGYDAQLCLVDLGETAARVVADRLGGAKFDFIVIGAGIRIVPKNFLLFEQLVNVVHDKAPHSKILFDDKPDGSSEAVARWR